MRSELHGEILQEHAIDRKYAIVNGRPRWTRRILIHLLSAIMHHATPHRIVNAILTMHANTLNSIKQSFFIYFKPVLHVVDSALFDLNIHSIDVRSLKPSSTTSANKTNSPRFLDQILKD